MRFMKAEFVLDGPMFPCDGVEENLRGNILGGPAYAPGFVLHILGQAKVNNLDVTLGVEEDIFRFEISGMVGIVSCRMLRDSDLYTIWRL